MLLRDDNWTEQEDKILVETILHYVRHGKPQLQAFEDVGEKIDRSGGACGYRWNAVLRKQYKEELRLAKRKYRGQRLDMPKLIKPKETKKNTNSKEAKELLHALNDVYQHTNDAQVKFIIGHTINFIKKSDASTSDHK